MVELLAPAGTPDALRAAIAAGADAVYVGLGAFNARASNAGLSLDELASACALAHSCGARVYVTLNVFVRDGELDDAVALAGRALAAGADALIVADMGLISRIRAELPGSELHLSTQAGAQCAAAVRFAARELGVERVTCARELSLAELAELCDTGVEIEAFCHGAICICYSGACSYSALMRGRSANRGDCTQPCRFAYELQDGSGAVLAGGAWERGGAVGGRAMRPDGDRLLCPRDYLGIRHVAAMLAAGVSAFKIEGRMKSPDYVYNVVRCYREALDAALAGRALDESELGELEARLARSFNRGFTSGYLEGGHAATGADLMSFERSINQGLYAGCVVEPRYEGALVAFEHEVAVGDMLEIRSTPGPDAPADVPKRWPIVTCPRDVRPGEEVLISCKRKVEAGSAVHLVRSAGLIAEAARAVEGMRAEEARLAARLGIGGGPLDFGARAAHARRKGNSTCPVAERQSGCEGEHSLPHGAQTGDFGHRASTLGDAREAGAVRGAIDLGEVCRSVDEPGVRAACGAVARGEVEAVVCRNIGQVELVRRAGVAWEAAPPLNVWNARTARVLQDLGAYRIWLPEELSDENVSNVLDAARPAGVTVPIARVANGSTPLMVMEHCILTAEGPCAGLCATCRRRMASLRGERFLVELDRNAGGARLQVQVDERGRTRILRYTNAHMSFPSTARPRASAPACGEGAMTL